MLILSSGTPDQYDLTPSHDYSVKQQRRRLRMATTYHRLPELD